MVSIGGTMSFRKHISLTYCFGLFDEIKFSRERGWRQVYKNFNPHKEDDETDLTRDQVVGAFTTPWSYVMVEMLMDRRHV